MKIDLIGLLFNAAGGPSAYDGLLIDEGAPVDAITGLHTMIMEYAKVCNGGESDIVVVPDQLVKAKP